MPTADCFLLVEAKVGRYLFLNNGVGWLKYSCAENHVSAPGDTLPVLSIFCCECYRSWLTTASVSLAWKIILF